MSRRAGRPAVRRALTAGLAGAALCHGGATAEAQTLAPDPAEAPAASPAPEATATPTPTPTPEPEHTPAPQSDPSPAPVAEPTPVAQPDPGSGELAPVAPAPDSGTAPRDTQPSPSAAVTAPRKGRIRGATDAAPDRGHRGTPPRARRDEQPAGHRPRTHRHPASGPDRSPRDAGPGTGPVLLAPMPIGVPDFFIDRFRIPPFLLPIYQAAGTEYGVRWEVLAAINEIETDYGRNLAVSPAGAVGWMQFMPSSWRVYGVDANHDGVKDPYNPFDAIFAAARYLRAAGADTDVRRAIFAYNHADWYVESVILRARVIGGMPSDLVGSLSGLVEGQFPVRARATYARHLDLRLRARGGRAVARLAGPAARPRSVRIFARAGAPAIAVHDARVTATGRSAGLGRWVTVRDAYGNRFTYGRLTAVPGTVRRGARVVGGSEIGRVARARSGVASHLTLRVRPAGRGAPWIDPTPLLDGWKLLESTAIYRAAGGRRLFGPGGEATIGQILLMPKEALARRVLADPRLEIYGCGRRDIEAGRIDRRVLAMLAFLATSGLRPTVTSLRCGHGLLTASGNVSEHSSGSAVDIAALNGIPIAGHQGAGSIADLAIQRLLTLQGAMKPHQIISAMTFEGADNTFAMGDHADHIHVGWRPAYGTGRQVEAMLRPKQWIRLIDRLGEIDNPVVRRPPLRSAGGAAGR